VLVVYLRCDHTKSSIVIQYTKLTNWDDGIAKATSSNLPSESIFFVEIFEKVNQGLKKFSRFFRFN